MRQPFKEKFLNDVDGDGLPIPYTEPMSLLNFGKAQNHPVVQAMLADHKCMRCADPEQVINPAGWQEVDGIKLPPITWADTDSIVAEANEFIAAHERYHTDFERIFGVSKLSDSNAPEQFVGRRK
jgi:hypothetical protein